MTADNKKMKFAVIGDPIKHSKSPVMHNAAYSALGMNAEYSAVHVKKDDLEDFAHYARNNLNGFNVTVPHKENIIQFLDGVSELSAKTGSVNTVTVKDGKLFGDSTDGYGLAEAVKESFDLQIEGKSFLFIGCGGTVKAVSYYLADEGAEAVRIANRTVSKAEQLAGKLRNTQKGGTVIEAVPLADKSAVSAAVAKTDIVIQATSLGLKDDDPSPFPEELIRPGLYMFDTIYKETAFLRNAQKHNIPCAGGFLMLIHQGAASFRIWTGITPPLDVMKQSLGI